MRRNDNISDSSSYSNNRLPNQDPNTNTTLPTTTKGQLKNRLPNSNPNNNATSTTYNTTYNPNATHDTTFRFKVLCLNVYSIRPSASKGNERVDRFLTEVDIASDQLPFIVLVQETWLDPSIDPQQQPEPIIPPAFSTITGFREDPEGQPPTGGGGHMPADHRPYPHQII